MELLNRQENILSHILENLQTQYKVTIKHEAIENNSANFLITSATLFIYYLLTYSMEQSPS